MGKIIALAKQKGGVGKTTATINLSAETGKITISFALSDDLK